MPKFSDYPQTTTLSENDLILVSNSTDGTRTITKANLQQLLLTITITFDASGGTGTVDPVSGMVGSSVVLPMGSTLTPPIGKQFFGWAFTPTSTTYDYQGGESFPIGTSNVTLYAVYR